MLETKFKLHLFSLRDPAHCSSKHPKKNTNKKWVKDIGTLNLPKIFKIQLVSVDEMEHEKIHQPKVSQRIKSSSHFSQHE